MFKFNEERDGMSWKICLSLLPLNFLFLTILLDIVFICVVSVADRLFWESSRMAETEGEHAHCKGQEQSIL